MISPIKPALNDTNTDQTDDKKDDADEPDSVAENFNGED